MARPRWISILAIIMTASLMALPGLAFADAPESGQAPAEPKVQAAEPASGATATTTATAEPPNPAPAGAQAAPDASGGAAAAPADGADALPASADAPASGNAAPTASTDGATTAETPSAGGGTKSAPAEGASSADGTATAKAGTAEAARESGTQAPNPTSQGKPASARAASTSAAKSASTAASSGKTAPTATAKATDMNSAGTAKPSGTAKAASTAKPAGAAKTSSTAKPTVGAKPAGTVSSTSAAKAATVSTQAVAKKASAPSVQTAATVHPGAAAGLVNGDIYILSSKMTSGRSVTAKGSNAVSGATDRTSAQQWAVSFTKDGYITLKNIATGKMLAVAGAKAAKGANVSIAAPKDAKNQKWRVEKNADGSLMLVSALSTKSGKMALGIAGASKAAGANIIIWTAGTANSMKWNLADATKAWKKMDEKAKAAKGTVRNGSYLAVAGTARKQVLDVTGASAKAGANIEIWEYNGGSNQKWKVQVGADGYASIKSLSSGLALAVDGGKAVAGANVIQAKPNGSRSQKWVVTRNGSTVRIESALWPNLSLDIAGASAKSGGNVRIAATQPAKAQSWTLCDLQPKVAKSASLATGWYSLRSALDKNYFLQVDGYSGKNGTPLALAKGNSSTMQVFRLVKAGSYYQLETGTAAGSYLDVEGGKVLPGTKAEIWRSNTDAAKYSLQYDKNLKGYRLVNVASGLALAPTSGKASQGSAVTAETPTAGSKAQTFILVARHGLLHDGGIYRINTALGGKRAVSVKDASTAEGAKTSINAYLKGVHQKWKISKVGGKANTYTIESLASGKLLTGSDASVTQRAAASGNTAQWWVPASSKGSFVLKNAKTGKVLDVSGASGADGTEVLCWQAKSSDNDNQRFSLTKVAAADSGMYEFALSKNRRYILDVEGASSANGAKIIVYTDNSADNQRWVYDASAGTIRSLASGKYLSVSGNKAKSGTATVQWSANSKAGQKWAISYDGGGKFKLASGLGHNLVLTGSKAGDCGAATVTTDGKREKGLQRWGLSSVLNTDPRGFKLIKSIVSNGHGSLNASYVVIHETANPGATAKNHRDYWSNDDTYAVHYTLDWTGDCYYCVPEDRLCWQVGKGNPYVVGVELCHATNASDFNKVYKAGVQWARWQLAKNGWGVDRLISHYDCTKKWGGSDHTDPIGYFQQYGKTWAQFKQDVGKALKAS